MHEWRTWAWTPYETLQALPEHRPQQRDTHNSHRFHTLTRFPEQKCHREGKHRHRLPGAEESKQTTQRGEQGRLKMLHAASDCDVHLVNGMAANPPSQRE